MLVCRLGLVDGSDAVCRHPAAVPDEHRRRDVSVRVRQPDCGAVRVDEAQLLARLAGAARRNTGAELLEMPTNLAISFN